ncbi:hypothetical protein BD324DRAFT_654499 [Kockovaella imperatae]|uniref:Uncharacterized protein n=1 Tax=Kockovaella imperatae TaxID=4999 RepID=A0A1Y1UTM0_9TREE|nr:hypothetical protein BD324DRAFT_654499 [Kockovaella imperatae]ORX40776.1 hypothetical protein BD324DRAFT_654499 [Kockovaella imperatae]
MYRLAISRSIRAAESTARVVAIRSASTTQGHTTAKAQDPGHKDKDVQSASATQGMSNKAASQASTNGQSQPFDAARQGGVGGESKVAPEGKGSFADQVGGQKGASSGGHKGGHEKTGADTLVGKVLDAFGGQNPKRQFHTWSSARNKDIPGADPKGARKPVDDSVHGDQNPHLKHSEGGYSGSAQSGNASADPHLPSRTKSKPQHSSNPFGSTPGASQSRSLHSSPTTGVKGAEKYSGVHEPEPSKAGYDSPSEPLPTNLKSSYPTNDPSATPAPPNVTPSSKVKKSSTSADPAHETLSQAAKEGTLGDRNPQPHPDAGRKGNDKAWKDRKP